VAPAILLLGTTSLAVDVRIKLLKGGGARAANQKGCF